MTTTSRATLYQGSAKQIPITLTNPDDSTPDLSGWTFEAYFGNSKVGTVKTWDNNAFTVEANVVTLDITDTDIVVASRPDYRLQVIGNDGSNDEVLLDLAVNLMDSLAVVG